MTSRVPERPALGRELVRISASGVFLSALKRAEDGNGYVARVVNMSDAAVNCRVECALPGEVCELTADERAPEAARAAQGALDIALGAWKIATLGLARR